jgi:Ca2+-binding RTX toxin-like protein
MALRVGEDALRASVEQQNFGVTVLSEPRTLTRRRRRLAVGAGALLVAVSGLTTGLQASASAATTATCFGKKATIVGGEKGTTIRGTSGDDVIYAGGGNDTVYGGGGHDLICGGYGEDRLHGGAGADWIAGQLGAKVHTSSGTRIDGDVLYGDSGDDFFSPGFDNRNRTRTPDRISFNESPAAVTVSTLTHTATGEGNDSWLGDRAEIVGSTHPDTFVGGPLADTFQGGGGADKMTGGAGNDVLRDDYPGSTHKNGDTLSGGIGDDQLFTTGGFDTLDGGDGNDLLSDYGRAAGSMQGGTGNDVINDGINSLGTQVDDGGPGIDTVVLYTNMHVYSWPRLYIDLMAGTGTFKDKSPFTVRSADKLYLHGAPLSYVGDSGDNLVYTDGMGDLNASGNAGNDTFYGGIGNDRYDGGPGSDKVRTGGGSDRCVSIESLMSGRCPAG